MWVQESKWQYMLRPHLNAPWIHRLLREIGFREHLVDFRRHSLSSPTSLSLHKRFRRRLHPDLHRQLRPEMLDGIQAPYSTLSRLGSNTGAPFQTMRDLLSAAFPSTQLFPAALLLCQRAVPLQGSEASYPGLAQARTPGPNHHDTIITTSTSTCSRLESQTRNLVATAGGISPWSFPFLIPS